MRKRRGFFCIVGFIVISLFPSFALSFSKRSLAYYSFIQAQIALQRHDIDTAIRYLKKTLSFDPKASSVMVDLAKAYLQKKDFIMKIL